MNTRTIAAVILAFIVIGGGAVMLNPLDDGPSDPPFETNNTPTPSDNTEMPDGIENNQVTTESVALSAINSAQKNAIITIQEQQQGETVFKKIVYTPRESHKVLRLDGKDIRETYYSTEYTAIQNFGSNGYKLSLEDPQNQISYHTEEKRMRAIIRAVPLTFDKRTTSNGTTYLKFSGDSLQDSESDNLAQELGVETVQSVDTAKVVMTENGVITGFTLDVRASNGDNSYPIVWEYTLEITPNATVGQPVWVQEALQQNTGIDAFIPSDSELILQHKYGKSIQKGDVIEIQTPTGKTYTKEVTDGFSTDDRVVITRDDGQLQIQKNPNSTVSGSEQYLSESGTYIVTIRNTEYGEITFATATK